VDEHGHLTHVGKIMADLNISPFLSRTLISAAQDFHCSDEILSIASLLSVEDFIISPRSEKKQIAILKARERFFDSSGDHITYWNIFHQWTLANCSKDFCSEYFFHYRAMCAAKNIREQLKTILSQHKLHLVSCLKKKGCDRMPSAARISVLSALDFICIR
jgi:HrpA-like RNA helicase